MSRKRLIGLVIGVFLLAGGAPIAVDASCVSVGDDRRCPNDGGFNFGGGDDGGGGAPTAPRPRRPKISINDVTALEGTILQKGPALNPFTFTVSLNKKSSKTVTVDYATSSGTAEGALPAGEQQPPDFVSEQGTVTFEPGQKSKTISIDVLAFDDPEPDETFFVNLSNPRKAKIKDGQGVGTIVNDDQQEG
jgi:hypothetical protein